VNVIREDGTPVFDSRGKQATVGRIVWGDEVDIDPDLLPVPQEQERETPKRDTAVAMLRLLLADGPQPVPYLKEQAKLEDVGWRTVKDAKASDGTEDRQFHVRGKRGAAWSWWGRPGTDWEAFRCAVPCLPDGCTPNRALDTLIEQGDWSPSGVRCATNPEGPGTLHTYPGDEPLGPRR
jgi:hypothetical protein